MSLTVRNDDDVITPPTGGISITILQTCIVHARAHALDKTEQIDVSVVEREVDEHDSRAACYPTICLHKHINARQRATYK
jgi:hypothetical protein